MDSCPDVERWRDRDKQLYREAEMKKQMYRERQTQTGVEVPRINSSIVLAQADEDGHDLGRSIIALPQSLVGRRLRRLDR